MPEHQHDCFLQALQTEPEAFLMKLNGLDLTDDSLEQGRLHIWQPRHGYRFAIDALLLADFVRLRHRDRAVELGTGCGVVALLIARRHTGLHVTAIEIQPRLAALARENIRRNRLDERVHLLEADLATLHKHLPAGGFDHVLSNPPYRPPTTGRLCHHPEEAHARHELLTDLPGLLAAARHLLRPGGRVSLVYPADRMVTLLTGLRKQRLEPKRLRLIHHQPEAPARLVLLEGCKDAGEELAVLPPLFLNCPNG